MVDYGFQWLPAKAGMFVPFDDGTSIQLWDDDDLCEQEVRRLAPADLKGWQAFCGVKQRLRDALRPEGDGDLWIGRAPSRDELEHRLAGDDEARKMLFEWSMVECLEHFIERRAPAVGLPGPGGHRHLRQPARPGHGVDPLSPPVGPAGRNARHVGVRRGRNGDGLVHPLRHRARRRRRRLDRRARRPHHPGHRRRARGRRADRIAVRRLERRPARDPAPAGRRRRSGLAGAGRSGPPGRLHRQAQHGAQGAAQLHGPARNQHAASSRPDQHAALQGGVADEPADRPRGRIARPALDRALFPYGPRPQRRARRACTR